MCSKKKDSRPTLGVTLDEAGEISGGGGGDIPIMVQVTIEQFGTTLVGTDIAGVVAALRRLPHPTRWA